MSTTYKNFSKLERFIEVLKGEYFQKYPEFTFEQIRRPIYLVAGGINNDYNRYRDEKLKMLAIDNYWEILGDREEVNLDGLEGAVFRSLEFVMKVEESVRYNVSECGNVPFPEEHKEKYLDFVSEMTERVVSDMCDTLEKRVSQFGKVEYWKWIGLEPVQIESLSSGESFIEKFSGAKRSHFEDKEIFLPKGNRRKVTFANKEARKSEGTHVLLKRN